MAEDDLYTFAAGNEFVNQEEEDEDTDEALIAYVERYPCIYSKTGKSHMDAVFKENAWKEIALSMHMPVEYCTHQWDKLRRKWTRERKIMKTPMASGSKAKPRAVWPLYGAMSFLEKCVQLRNTFTNATKTLSIARKSPSEIASVLEDAPAPSAVETNKRQLSLAATTPGAFYHEKKKKTDDLSKVLESSFSTLGAMMEKRGCTQPSAVPEMGFATDIANMINKINGNKKQAQCKRRILEVMEEFLSDDEQ